MLEKLEKKMLGLKNSDNSLRLELLSLIGCCRVFDTLWSQAPRRKLVFSELQNLQKSFRRRPESIQKHLFNLSPEASHQLNLAGLNENTGTKEIKKIIRKAILNTPKDKGGRAANEQYYFLVGQFSRLCKQHTKLRPALTYDPYKDRHSGEYLHCLSTFASLIWENPPSSETLAEIHKALNYNKK